VLEVTNLHLWRGERYLLRGLNFQISPGQGLQLLWPNGTGKTSLLRCIAGFVAPEEGAVCWNGSAVTKDREAFNRDLAYLGHEGALKGDLTAIENIRYACALRRPHSAAQIRQTLAVMGLHESTQHQVVRSLSAGQKRRVAMARLTLWGARLWLLDEPVANLDSAGQTLMQSILLDHLKTGGMAILATHQAIDLDGAHCRVWNSPEVGL
jgi:heme exporter protein A